MHGFSVPSGLSAATLFLGLSLAPLSARADLRFGCMAQADHLKMAIHVEFSTELGGRVSHLTGRLLLDAPDAPPELRKMAFDRTMITQVWSDREHVMMRFYTEAVTGGPVMIRIATELQEGTKGPLVGTYRIDQPHADGPAMTYSGRAICKNDTPDDATAN